MTLVVKEHPGNWQAIYRMLAINRAYQYFPRGMHEVVNDLQRYPALAIEKNLLLVYERDFVLYLSRQGRYARPEYLPLIEKALFAAKESGLIERMLREYWGEDRQALRYHDRTVLRLQTPPWNR